MSNAEMPPLATGQVWVNRVYVVLIGNETKKDSRRYIWANADFIPPETLTSSDTAIRELLGEENITGQPFRLIHGPGAPWSPEETSHA